MEGRTPSNQQVEDAPLVARMTGGDPVALRLFYDRHSPVVYAICLRILGNPPDAEEVLIDVFQEFWQRASTFDGSRGTPLGMLVTLARSRAIDRRRSRKSPPAVVIQDSDVVTRLVDRPDNALVQFQERDRIRQALQTLSPEQRRSIECAYYDGMSHSEIAEALQKPLGTVKTYIRQGLLRMRQVLGTGKDT